MFPKIVDFPPKASILIEFSIKNHPFWGTTIFGNTYIPIGEHTYTHRQFFPIRNLQSRNWGSPQRLGSWSRWFESPNPWYLAGWLVGGVVGCLVGWDDVKLYYLQGFFWLGIGTGMVDDFCLVVLKKMWRL